MSHLDRTSYQVRYWKKPLCIDDQRGIPISDSAAAQLRQNVTRRLSDLPAQLDQHAVGATWERSAEDSMREYQLLDTAAQSIDILKALNTRDRDMIQIEAKRKRKEEEPAVLKAMKFRVSPEDMEKTRNDMREIRERGSQISCVKDCMPEILYCFDMKWSSEPAFVPELRAMELIMNKVRAAAMKLQAENPDGHWATELLNFYSDDWMVWLDEINENYVEKWSSDIFHEKWEGAKQRIKVVEEILEEVEKERRQKSYGYGLNGCGRGG